MRVRATVTCKGQVTIPVEIRRRLGVKDGGPVEYVVAEDGKIVLEPPRFVSVHDLTGIAGKLPEPVDWPTMREIAREDALLPKYLPSSDA
jgi:AbrB family looped-hinge helix DNA binding protein